MADGPPPQRPGDEPNDDDQHADDPLASLPLFGDLSRALAHQGPLNWDAARQFAQLSSTAGEPEHNVDPAVRLSYEQLSSIASMHVADVLGATSAPSPTTVTRSQWAHTTLEAYRHLFTEMATSLGAPPAGGPEASDPMAQMMAGLAKLMGPAMVGMSVGSMVGRLSTRTFGTHDLPIPRQPDSVTIVPVNVDAFAGTWEIPLDEMRLWVLAHEITGYELFAAGHVRDALSDLVRRHAGGFQTNPDALADKLGDLDAASGDPMAAFQQALNDPELLLGAVTSPAQEALRPQLDALVAATIGFVDWVVDAVAARLIGGDALRIAEAVRRQRVESSTEDRFVEQLLGIRIGEAQVTRGKAFVQGVVDRAGESALRLLLDRPDSVPTPNELDAPGLWLARLEGPPPEPAPEPGPGSAPR